MSEPIYVDMPDPDDLCEVCGREKDSFACKIRHVQVNTGWAKAAND